MRPTGPRARMATRHRRVASGVRSIGILFACLAPAALLGVAAAADGDGSLGVYADLNGTQTEATFSIGVPRTLYVLARLDGRTIQGVSGAEFRVAGFPGDWFVFLTPSPNAVITLGNPFRSQDGVHRANIVFSACQPGLQGRLLLYTAVVVPTSSVAPVLVVEAGSPPANPNYPFPLLNLCDSPNFTKVPVAGDSFFVHTRAPQDLDYSSLPGYDEVRGVQPMRGAPGDVFHFRVMYTNAADRPPEAGSPRLELDANGDGDALDPGEGSFTMSPADQDSTLTNGKAYAYEVALGTPPGGRYRYRFTANDHNGAPVGGAATTWLDSLFVSPEMVDLVVRSENIRVLPEDPDGNRDAAVVARIDNPSAQRLENVRVRVEDVFHQVIAERTLSFLGPHSSAEIACAWRFADLGFQPVVVRVDPENAIDELDEANNAASRAVFVGVATTSGQIVIAGLPPLVTVPPLAPFLVQGSASYHVGSLPPSLVRGALVTARPSWEGAGTTHTDADGRFARFVTPPAVPGTYHVTFSISDGARADSVQVAVLVAAAAGAPHAPNLAVRLGVAAGASCPPEAAQVTWSVENRGDVASPPTTVRLLAEGVTTVAEVDVGAIAPGGVSELAPVTVQLHGTGPRAFTAHVDPVSAVHEMREDDNVATAVVVVPPGCLDLALAAVRYDSDRFCTDTALRATVDIENRGCSPSNPARLAVRSGGAEIASIPTGALAPGAVTQVVFTRNSSEGCAAIDFVLDPEGAAGEDCVSENDVQSSFACIAKCGNLPPVPPADFQVLACDIAVSNTRPSTGEPLRFTAWISNIGPSEGQPVQVRFSVDGILIGGGGVTVGPIAPRGRLLVTSPGTWPAGFTPHTLRVSIDPGSQDEWYRENNEASRVLPWNLRPKAIPRCPGESPSMFSTCSPCTHSPVDIRAVVVNDGLFDCDSVTVEFRDQLHGGAILGRAVAHDVRGGDACTTSPVLVSVSHAFTVAGTHRVAAVVDPDDAWAETNEADNHYAQDLTLACGPAPDLVAAVRLPLGATPQPGDTVRAVEVEVTNRGSVIAYDVRARLKLDGTPLCTLDMGNLHAGASNTVTCTTPWVVAAERCGQRLEACADPDGQIGESNEANNCAQTGVTTSGITDLAIYPWDIRVSPTDPTPGQLVVFEIGMHNARMVESTCYFIGEWSIDHALWLPMAVLPLGVPAVAHLPNAVSFQWTFPVASLYLRFRLTDICPTDVDPSNNVAEGTLPWFTSPGTPVVVTDLVGLSTPEGVRIRWRAEPVVAAFVVERRRESDAIPVRLPEVTPTSAGPELETFEVLDRDAESGARLEYTLLARWPDGSEEILRTLTVLHDAMAALGPAHLWPVRPNPFRPGERIEFSLATPRDVDLCIFDTAGRRIVQLHHGTASSGRHAVTWDGRDDTGGRVPAGVYFCRLVSGSLQQNRRIVLVH